MSEMQRVMGRLEEFRESAEKRFDGIDDKVGRLHEKVDNLNQFRWRIVGGAAIAMLTLSGLSEVIRILIPLIMNHVP